VSTAPVDASTAAAAPSRLRHEARPGRRVLVIGDLADLRGPATGRVTLPLRLFWSSRGTATEFDLARPAIARSMYENVLREASHRDELAAYLNPDLLVAFWPDLALPRDVRQAWEAAHPALGEDRARRYTGDMTTATRSRPVAGVMRRPVLALPLAELHGPASGPATPPRRLWWSGSPTIDLDDLGQVAVFYESVLNVGSAADLADWLDADLLAGLWPSLGMRHDQQARWEAVNPQLAARTASAGAAA
jgi:hypothetical protein